MQHERFGHWKAPVQSYVRQIVELGDFHGINDTIIIFEKRHQLR